jgi:hypothetical protein
LGGTYLSDLGRGRIPRPKELSDSASEEALSAKYADDPERLTEEGDKLEAQYPLPPLPLSKLSLRGARASAFQNEL